MFPSIPIQPSSAPVRTPQLPDWNTPPLTPRIDCPTVRELERRDPVILPPIMPDPYFDDRPPMGFPGLPTS